MNTHISEDFSALTLQVATWITEQIEGILEEQERCTLVLSGGSTPEALYRLLASDPWSSRISWRQLHIFWGDERYVPDTDPSNNARMAYETLLDHVPVPANQIHRMRTDMPPEASAAAYEQILRGYFSEKGTTFDIVLLGMGDDGHTLSLFPHHSVINEKEKWVTTLYLEEQEMNRITLTVPVVNRAARIAFLISGAGKPGALQHVLGNDMNPDLYPAQIIRSTAGALHWFVDKAAAKDLPNN